MVTWRTLIDHPVLLELNFKSHQLLISAQAVRISTNAKHIPFHIKQQCIEQHAARNLVNPDGSMFEIPRFPVIDGVATAGNLYANDPLATNSLQQKLRIARVIA